MVSENPESATAMVKDTKPAGTVDEEKKKIYDEMKARAAQVPDYIRMLKTGPLLERSQPCRRKSTPSPASLPPELL